MREKPDVVSRIATVIRNEFGPGVTTELIVGLAGYVTLVAQGVGFSRKDFDTLIDLVWEESEQWWRNTRKDKFN